MDGFILTPANGDDHRQGGAEFTKTHRDALEPLLHWRSVTRHAVRRHPVDVRASFAHADTVGLFTVIKYRWQVIYIRSILTHADYDEGKWKL
jgi:mRNA interferase HigB